MNKNRYCLWIALVVLGCLSIAARLPAQDIGGTGDVLPTDPLNHRIIVFLRSDQISEDAAGFAERLMDPGSAGEALRASLEFPITARPTVNVPPLPDGRQPIPMGPRDRLARYLTLEYPSIVDLNLLLARLGLDQRLGFVGQADGSIWSATRPRDPLYSSPDGLPQPRQQEYFQQLGFESAWDHTKGHAIVGVADTGVEVGHEDLAGNLRLHHSWNFEEGHPNPSETGRARGHGTHVAGILAADTDNALGVAGSCWNCSLLMSRAPGTGERVGAFTWMAGNGAQIVNLSGAETAAGVLDADFPPGVPCATTPHFQQHVFCPLLELLEAREIAFTVSSGNERRRIDFPANEPSTIAVGGIERSGELWDDFDRPGCILDPPAGASGWGDFFQCGSNFGPEQDFAAPAKQVLSTFFTGFPYAPAAGCSDDPNHPNTLDPEGNFRALGYDWCTGTSMSAPFVAGVFGLVRSVNPLLSVADAKRAIAETTSRQGSRDEAFGFGPPDAAAAVERTLGTSGGVQMSNRLTPMFSLFAPAASDYLYTSKPQVASAAVAGTLHQSPTSSTILPYGSASVGAPVAGVAAFPVEPSLPSPVPTSSFWVFTSDVNPFDSVAPLVPLYRLSFADDCSSRDHVYATSKADVDLFTGADGRLPDQCPEQPGDQGYRLDAIEGYVFSHCPPGFTCDDPQDPGQPQCIHRRSRAGEGGHALVMERELGQPPYESYTGVVGGSCIGYVFPNSDSDGDQLIDGFELLLGTLPGGTDSDCDGAVDGSEVPIAGLPVSDPLDGNCPVAIQYGTEETHHLARTVALSGFRQPIVVMGPPSLRGGQPVTMRLQNVGVTSFEHRLKEWDFLDGVHMFESASYLVLEAGESELGGLQAEAGSVEISEVWETVVFSTPFASAPVVLTQVVKDADPAAVTTRVRNVTSTGFEVRLQEEEAADGVHGPAEVHFIAIEPGIARLPESRMIVGTTERLVTDDFFKIRFSLEPANAAPAFLAAAQTIEGGDTATLRHRRLYSASVEVKMQEERSANAEVDHLPEIVGFVAIY